MPTVKALTDREWARLKSLVLTFGVLAQEQRHNANPAAHLAELGRAATGRPTATLTPELWTELRAWALAQARF